MIESEREKANVNGVPVARRHIFLCSEQTSPNVVTFSLLQP